MSVAKFGEPFTAHRESADVDLGDEVYVGLFVCSHNPKVQETAVFSNVRIVVPPKAGWTPYRDYIGSNLEIMTSPPARARCCTRRRSRCRRRTGRPTARR